MNARLLVRDGGLGGAAGRFPHVHGARFGHGLHARGGVDQITGHHPLARRPDRDGGFARENSGPSPEIGRADLDPEVGDGGDEVQCRPDGALGIVLLGDRRPPHGHDRITDEFLHGPAVAGDELLAGLEIPAKQVADLLGVAGLGECGESD